MVIRSALATALGATFLATATVGALADTVKIGVLTDMTGVFSDVAGKGAVDAVQMAVEDFGGEVLGNKIEIVSGDHLNKPDVGALIARQWFDEENVDLIIDLTSSAVAFAVQKLGVDKDRIVIATSAASSDITSKNCTPNSFAWGYDCYSMSHVAVPEIVKQGAKNWFLIAPDYAYGHAAIRDLTKVIEANGGKVLGDVKHPLGAPDFSSFLFQAQAANPDAIGVLSAITDLQNTLKQGREFQVFTDKVKLVVPSFMMTDVKAIGLEATQGTYVSSAVYYWDTNEKTREFGLRFLKRNGHPPSEAQAMNYSAITHYLKSVKAAGTDKTQAVLAKMRELPINDATTENGTIREDGRVMRPSYLAQVKSPAESKGEWDFYKILATVPAEQAFRPLSESECPLVKKN